ncbi:MAG: hypothetical protein AB1540_06125 [Bdellovibrionota bacterium]
MPIVWVVFLYAFCVGVYAQDTPASKQAEALREKGVRAFDDRRFDESQDLFNQSLNWDSDSQTAKDYLQRLEQRKKEPQGRRERARDHGDPTRDKKPEFDAAKRGAISGSTPPASQYNGLPESPSNSNDARLKTASNRATMVRPQRYQLPQMYERLGFPLSSPSQLDNTRFRTRDEMYLIASRWPDAFSHQVDGALFLHYDSDLANITTDRYASYGLRNEKGVTQNAMLALGTHSSPQRRWMYGADFKTLYKRFARAELRDLDHIAMTPSLWLSWWNTGNSEFSFRYDYAQMLRDGEQFRQHHQVHGPQLGFSALVSRDYHFDFNYSLKRNHYSDVIVPDASDLNGTEHGLSLKLTYSNKNLPFKPFGRYSFDRNETRADAQSATVNAFEAGLIFEFNGNARALASAQYQLTDFTSNENPRHDHMIQLHAAFLLPVGQSFTLIFDSTYLDYDSSIPETYAYHRLNGVLGFMYSWVP